MREPLSLEQWAAIRAVLEGAAPTHARVAAAVGVNATTISHKAAQEEWRGLDFRSPRVREAHRRFVELAARHRNGESLDPPERDETAGELGEGLKGMSDVGPAMPPLPDLPEAERQARLRALLTGRLEDMLRQAEAGRPIEARQVSALAAMAQLFERIAPQPSSATPPPQAADEEGLRETMQRIDDRILYLAAGMAAKLLVKHGLSHREAVGAVLSDAWLCERLEANGMLLREGPDGEPAILGLEAPCRERP